MSNGSGSGSGTPTVIVADQRPRVIVQPPGVSVVAPGRTRVIGAGGQGLPGAQGTKGDKGDKGDIGDTGPQGPPGSIGGLVWNETPAGAIDGVNAAFALGAAPLAGALVLSKNGLIQAAGSGNDFTLSGATVTFQPGAIPDPGDHLLATYPVA